MSQHSGSALERFQTLDDFPAFAAFADALWRNEAAVMVGAGLSTMCDRNADSPVPPLWSTFAVRMTSALGYEPAQSSDPLRLAQEFQALHGEEGLDRLIRSLVADRQWSPGELHKQLLELPWQDVLTTNWDTLLERTAPSTPDRVYRPVLTIEDISHVTRPRIVKLHGSLPSQRPFIFTEDDFRTYPKKFAPFVNLAQQVMLENELCLIGFSGIDPNFLAWSGWVRDTLGAAARSIRLVGSLNLKPSARLLLERRHVTPIDIAPLVSDFPQHARHRQAMELFLRALREIRPPSPYQWIKISRSELSEQGNSSTESRRAIVTAAWQNDRNTYPGWIVAPESQSYDLRHGENVGSGGKDPSELLSFAAERIWRHRVGGIWLNSYDLDIADQYYDEANHKLTPDLRRDLCSYAASEWRKYHNWEKWSRWMDRLQSIGEQETRFRHSYERGLKAQLDWDDIELAKAIDDLRTDQPVWMMRRASLLAAQFRHKEAAELYEAALRSIRIKLLDAPQSAWLISLEGWASIFLRASYHALRDGNDFWPDKETEETRLRFVSAKADPWETITRLEKLAADRIKRNRDDNEEWSLNFDAGSYRSAGIDRIFNDDSCPFYGLIDIMESVGAPVSIGSSNVFSTRLTIAYSALLNADEFDLLMLLSKYQGGDQKLLDRILNRINIAKLTDTSVSLLVERIPIRIFDLLNRNARYGRRSDSQNYIAFLLDLLSRLVIRKDTNKALEIFQWTYSLLSNSQLSHVCYRGLGCVLRRSLEPMTGDDRRKALSLSLALPLPEQFRINGFDSDWPEIFERFSKAELVALNLTQLDRGQIDNLIASVTSDGQHNRGRALRRLHLLYNAQKLTDDQSVLLGQAIWARTDGEGWPAETDLHPWIFLELPETERAVSLFLSNIVNPVASGKIDSATLMNLRIGLPHIAERVSQDDLMSCLLSCLNWTPDEKVEDDPLRLTSRQRHHENIQIEQHIGFTIAKGLLPVIDPRAVAEKTRELLLSKASEGSFSTIPAAAFYVQELWPSEQARCISILRSAIASRNIHRTGSAYSAIFEFINNASKQKNLPIEIKNLVIESIQLRAQPGLNSAIAAARKMADIDILDHGEINSLISSIGEILEEYSYSQTQLDVPAMAVMSLVRQQAHKLLKTLSLIVDEPITLLDTLSVDPLPEVRLAQGIETALVDGDD